MTNTLPTRAASLGWLLLACGVAPSRAPLGGNYTMPESAPAADRHAQPEASAIPDAAAPEPTPVAPASAASAATEANAVAPIVPADAVHFEPLQVGSRIKAEATLTSSADMRGGPPGMFDKAKLGVDGRLRVEIEVLKASAQSLDEIALTLTTLSMHTEIGGHDMDSKQEPPVSYDITLSGASPTIRPRTGSKLDPVERVKIALFVVPLVEFYTHWARVPTLELKRGWTSKVSLPFAATLFAMAKDETLSVGPLSTRFMGRAPASDDLPFELALPVEYAAHLGKLRFDLSGSAKLNAKSGRPTAFDMSGPLSGTGGARGMQTSVTGTVKLAGTLSYP